LLIVRSAEKRQCKRELEKMEATELTTLGYRRTAPETMDL